MDAIADVRAFKKLVPVEPAGGVHPLTPASYTKMTALMQGFDGDAKGLEIGCGVGHGVLALVRAGAASVRAVDINEDAVLVAARALPLHFQARSGGAAAVAVNVAVADVMEWRSLGTATHALCIIGCLDLTLHVLRLFRASASCVSLAFLKPTRGLREDEDLEGLAWEPVPVSIAGSNERRTVYVLNKEAGGGGGGGGDESAAAAATPPANASFSKTAANTDSNEAPLLLTPPDAPTPVTAAAVAAGAPEAAVGVPAWCHPSQRRFLPPSPGAADADAATDAATPARPPRLSERNGRRKRPESARPAAAATATAATPTGADAAATAAAATAAAATVSWCWSTPSKRSRGWLQGEEEEEEEEGDTSPPPAAPATAPCRAVAGEAGRGRSRSDDAAGGGRAENGAPRRRTTAAGATRRRLEPDF